MKHYPVSHDVPAGCHDCDSSCSSQRSMYGRNQPKVSKATVWVDRTALEYMHVYLLSGFLIVPTAHAMNIQTLTGV